MSAELWTAYTALRDARSLYDDPFFDPDFARLVGQVREDTRIGVAFDGEDVVGFWPLHERPGLWARPIGGP
ncbi:MAG: cellulose biosynthesis protein CelD, partial [Pseudomonadota bacterium]